MNEALISAIRRDRVIAIMRHLPDEQVVPVFGALAAGGIRLIEVTMNTAGAAAQIRLAKRHFADRMQIGAGTVSTPERAVTALAAGADFLVTPNLDLEVLEYAARHGCPVIPGVFTPTEMMTAIKAGVRILKLFPAGQLGPGYVRDVLAPLDTLNLVAVGGVTPDNAADWLRAGCIGVGMGSALLPAGLLQSGDFAGLASQTADLLHRLQD